jgi:hypothetical protein
MLPDSSFIKELLGIIRPDLKQIAYKTKGETSFEDLENEAYLLLLDFINRHERQPFLWEPKDLRWITGRLHNRFVKWTDQALKNAVRMHSKEDKEGESWTLDLPALESSDPLTEILFRDELLEYEHLLETSYSEAKAYVVSFDHFNQDKKVLSKYWHITSDTLDRRFNRSIVILKHQRSLFDSKERIDNSFNPIPGREILKINKYPIKEQFAWSF